MVSNILEAIEGIGIYSLASMFVFVPFFIGVLVYVVRLKKEDSDKMSQLPLN
jgi:cytochrome c oxidase cbb3-type subunit III